MVLASEVPRRMRRFYRKAERGESIPEEGLLELGEQGSAPKSMEEAVFEQASGPKAGKKRTMQLALREVKRFKEAHKRLPKKEEYEQIAESIFAQLKDERAKERAVEKTRRITKRLSRKSGKVAGRGEERLPRKEKEIAETLEKIRGLDIKDLFEEEQKDKEAKEGELGELSELDLGDLEPANFETLQEEKKPEEEACPNCGSKEEIIYCPGCGAAYCKKCAKKVEELADRTRYYCPKCGRHIER